MKICDDDNEVTVLECVCGCVCVCREGVHGLCGSECVFVCVCVCFFVIEIAEGLQNYSIGVSLLACLCWRVLLTRLYWRVSSAVCLLACFHWLIGVSFIGVSLWLRLYWRVSIGVCLFTSLYWRVFVCVCV